MKKITLWLLLCLTAISSFAQNPSYTDKLFYTCKLYGFVKYYHSEVSTCKVNWDSVLVDRLPAIKAATTKNDFNNVLMEMLDAAGPMAQAGTPMPDTLPAELKRNRDWGWTNDALLRSDVSTILNSIKDNFVPHDICWVEINPRTNPNIAGLLVFPADTNYVQDLSIALPGESMRLFAFFKYWNILNYFNPYKYLLDEPWDKTMTDFLPGMVNTTSLEDFRKLFIKMDARLNDAHVEITTPLQYHEEVGNYSTNLRLRNINGQYVAVQANGSVKKGDAITSIDGLTMQQWEDSLRPYISAGNPTVFGRFVKSYAQCGKAQTNCNVLFTDSTGASQSTNIKRSNRVTYIYDDNNPTDSLKNTKFKIFGCGIAYINPSQIDTGDVEDIYAQIKNAPVWIMDMRHYTNFYQSERWFNHLHTASVDFAKIYQPDTKYPGTYTTFPSKISKQNTDVFTGKLIILSDETNQSVGETSIMYFQRYPNSTTVGTQTAGANGNITYIRDIFKHVFFCYTSQGWHYPNGDVMQRTGAGPRNAGDVLVQLTQEGIRHGRDEILEAALKAAGCPLSTEEIQQVMNGATIYPNPATNTFSIKTSGAIIKVYSLTGQLMLETNQPKNINISSLPTGVYVVQITTDGQTQTQKLIKE